MCFAVIWDVDGTLVDTADMHYEAWTVLAKEMNRPFSRADFNATFGWRNPEALRKVWGDHWTDQEIADFGARKEVLYRAAAQHGVALLPGARHLVESLHAAGFKQAVGSSAPRANVDLILRVTKIEPFLEATVAMEDTQRGKPDPQVFLLAAARLSAEPSRCLVLEDAVAGVQAAHAAGMKCIAVRFVGHHPEEKLKAAGADLVVASLEQVDVETVRKILHN
jgi:beta-phosphoglucomutase